jgi:protein-arginine kinase activator protein McsA
MKKRFPEKPCPQCGAMVQEPYMKNHERYCGKKKDTPPVPNENMDSGEMEAILTTLYTNRLIETHNVCPFCREQFRTFRRLDKGLLACLKCGTVFASQEARDVWIGEVKGINWSRIPQ